MSKVGYIFAGQGSQSVGMGRDFYTNSDTARELVELSSQRVGFDFAKLMFEENDDLAKTEYTQPAILLVSAIAHKLFNDALDIKPEFALGHSLGEFSALVSVGGLDIVDAVELVHNRGKFMAEACEGKGAGMMVLLGLSDEKVEEIVSESGKSVWAANYNNDGQIVVAGLKDDLSSMESVFKDAGAKRAMLLNMSVASHCPILAPAQDGLKTYLEKYLYESFAAPVISNVTAEGYSTKSEALPLLVEQLVKPVLYKQSIEKFCGSVENMVEFGNGAVLKGLNKKLTSTPTLNISDMASLESVVNQLS